jgi:LmbE family N-acetylglucosaminyl deacetylase
VLLVANSRVYVTKTMSNCVWRPGARFLSRSVRRLVVVGLFGVSLSSFGLMGCSGDSDESDPGDAAQRSDGPRDARSDRVDSGDGGTTKDAADSALPSNDAPAADASVDAELGLDAEAQADGADAGDVKADQVDAARDALASADADAAAHVDAAADRSAPDAASDAGNDTTPDRAVDLPDAVEVSPDSGALNPEDSSVLDASAEPAPVEASLDVSAPPADASDGAAPVIDAPAPQPDVPVPPGSRWLALVAHPDDDVLFMNPDLDRAIQSGAVTRTVMVTSGDMSEGGDWNSRETRIKNAHAFMAGVASNWSCGNVAFAGHQVVTCTLAAAHDSLVFIRLRDGGLDDLWVRSDGEPPFGGATHLASMVTIDNAQSYTRDEVVSVMRAIMVDFAPTKLLTLDGTLAYGSDTEHRDHVVTGLFALNAAQAYGHLESFTYYRGYTMTDSVAATETTPKHDPEPVNLTAAEYSRKATIMNVYDATDGAQYDKWCQRQYPIPNQLGDGTLRLADQCMQASSAAAPGVGVVLGPCTGETSQRWSVRADGHVVDASGLCLASADVSLSAELATCADLPGQKWLWDTIGQLHAGDANCLTAEGSNLRLELCDRDDKSGYAPWEQQIWIR